MADAATDALIAKLMAEEGMGYYEDNPYFEEDESDGDEDYGSSRRKKGKGGRKGAAKGRGSKGAAAATTAAKKATAAAAANGDDTQRSSADQDEKENQGEAAAHPNGSAEVELTATGRKKRKDAGQSSQRGPPKAWTEEEESKFIEALNLFGRDWKAVGRHIGTRDARAVASHAQKHFIRLCTTGEPLPAKVAESGPGYTLSGKLLDPVSSAARAYGLSKEVVYKLSEDKLKVALAGIDPSAWQPKEPQLDENGNPIPEEPAAAAAAPAKAPRAAKGLKQPKEPKVPPAKRRKQEQAAAAATAEPAGPPQQTEYARNRPKRELASSRTTLGGTSESLSLVRCSDYIGAPGCGAPLSQPFAVEVHAEAMLTMDFHSHLSCHEVIGLLGGSWDPARRHLLVQEAYPCRRMHGSVATTSVEIDPEAQLEAHGLMEQRGQKCVGWYHSHPVFQPTPSLKDMDNQRNYQAHFRCADSCQEPFIGVILGPYDTALPQPVTAVTFFNVQQRSSSMVPYRLRYKVQAIEDVHDMELAEKLVGLVEQLQHDLGRVNLREQWREFTSFDGLARRGPALSKGQKMGSALRRHLVGVVEDEAEQFLNQLLYNLQQAWGMPLGIVLGDTGTTPAAEGEEQEQQQEEEEGGGEEQQQEQQQEEEGAAGVAAEATAAAAEVE